MDIANSHIVPIVVNIDIGAQSSMFCCTICLDLVQDPDKHRQCCECGNTICTDCIKHITWHGKCPICRLQTRFIVNRVIHREIYPMVLKKCRWKECSVKMLHIYAHSSACEWREVECPVCKIATPLKSIHVHLANKCILPWGTVVRGTTDDFTEELKNVPKLPRGNYFRIFDLTPKGFGIKQDDARLIYFWRRNSPKLGFIRMMCIQLCAGPNETIEFARSSDGVTSTMSVQSIYTDTLHSIVIESKEIDGYSQINVYPNLQLFAYGSRYVVNHSRGSHVCTHINFAWNPTSVILVDTHGVVHSVDVSTIIKYMHQKQNSDSESELTQLYLPEPSSLEREPDVGYPGSSVDHRDLPSPLEDNADHYIYPTIILDNNSITEMGIRHLLSGDYIHAHPPRPTSLTAPIVERSLDTEPITINSSPRPILYSIISEIEDAEVY